jgi:hypothetical protein
MPSDIQYLIRKYFQEMIHKFIEYDLTTGRTNDGKIPLTKNEIINFLNINKNNIENTIYDLIQENDIKTLELCKGISEEFVKVILYEYVIYDE